MALTIALVLIAAIAAPFAYCVAEYAAIVADELVRMFR